MIKNRIKATFMGEDGSMGLKRGNSYYVYFGHDETYSLVLFIERGLWAGYTMCPYGSVSKLLENWIFD